MHDHPRTDAGTGWRTMIDAARGQTERLGDPSWTAPDDLWANRVDSFRAGQRTDANLVDFLAARVGPTASVLEIGAGAGRLILPLASKVGEVLALEPSASMSETLLADAASAGAKNVRLLAEPWEDLRGPVADAAYAAHVVYALPGIEDFVLRLRTAARTWCAMVLFADPPQSRLFDFWLAVFGEARLPNPCLPQFLAVAWSLGIYPDVTMLDVPAWPLGPPERARQGLRQRLHIVAGSAADARLERAMADLLVDWGDGSLGPPDRRPLKVAVAHWFK